MTSPNRASFRPPGHARALGREQRDDTDPKRHPPSYAFAASSPPAVPLIDFPSPTPKIGRMASSGGWSESDWYAEGDSQLHFFPLPKQLLWTNGRKIIAQTEAWGGINPKRGVHYSRMKPQPTTPGGYVISGSGPYHTPRWPLSRIGWGTPIRLDPGRSTRRLGVQRLWTCGDQLLPGSQPQSEARPRREDHGPK
jgi:hypothetical protein